MLRRNILFFWNIRDRIAPKNYLLQKSVGVDLGAEFFREGFVGGFEGIEVNGNGVAAFVLGLKCHTDLIPAHVSTVQLEFVADFVVERLFEIGLPDFTTFIKDGLGFGTKNFLIRNLRTKKSVASNELTVIEVLVNLFRNKHKRPTPIAGRECSP